MNREIVNVHGQEDSILSRCQFFLINRFNEIPIKILENYFSGDKLTLKGYMKRKKTQNSQHHTEKKRTKLKTDTTSL